MTLNLSEGRARPVRPAGPATLPSQAAAPAPAVSSSRGVAPAPAVASPFPVPARLRRIAVEAVKFGIVGGSGVLVNFLVFNFLLHGLSWTPMAATALAAVVAMATNYLGFRCYAYRDRASRTRRQIVLFFALSGLGVVTESALFYAGYRGLGMDGPLGANVAKALSIVLASAFRFLTYRTWVFQVRRAAR